MDLLKLAKKHLEDGLSKGYITLDDEVVKELKPSEILGIAKYVIKEGIFTEEEVVDKKKDLPLEFFMGSSEIEEDEEE